MLVDTPTNPTNVPERTAHTPRPLRMLVVSSLYPNVVQPRHGVFVETRLRELLQLGGIEAHVLAPVPWFPSTCRVFGRYAQLAAVPRHEMRHGIAVTRPRYAFLPKIGMRLQPSAMAGALMHAVDKLARLGHDFDVVDAHYFYPDGVAAAQVASRLGKPYVITARGSDLNLIAEQPYPRRRIIEAAEGAERVICVSAALRARAMAIGIPPERIEVLRNGVDTELFRRVDPARARSMLGIRPDRSPVLLAVGNLVPEKQYTLALSLLPRWPEAQLVIVGDGPERSRLLHEAAAIGVADRVMIRSAVPQTELPPIYSAADVLLLTSLREGWPNVLLETMACGTPVLAMDVGGTAEIIGGTCAARVVATRSTRALHDALEDLLRTRPTAELVRAHALSFGWREVVEKYRQVLMSAARRMPLDTEQSAVPGASPA